MDSADFKKALVGERDLAMQMVSAVNDQGAVPKPTEKAYRDLDSSIMQAMAAADDPDKLRAVLIDVLQADKANLENSVVAALLSHLFRPKKISSKKEMVVNYFKANSDGASHTSETIAHAIKEWFMYERDDNGVALYEGEKLRTNPEYDDKKMPTPSYIRKLRKQLLCE